MAAVVAAGAGGDSAWAPLRFGRPGSTALVLVLATAAIVGVAGAWILLLLLRRGHLGPDSELAGARTRSETSRRVFPLAVAAVALVGLLGISRLDLGFAAPQAGAERPDGVGRPGRLLDFLDNRSPPVRDSEGAEGRAVLTLDPGTVPLAAALLVLLGGGAALAWWWLGGRKGVEGSPEEEIDVEAARGTVLRSIEGMLADADPNTAVIGAYARLLEGLAASGVPRRDYEAPLEHLRRALLHLRVRPGPVRRLVDLFEIARFSTRVLTVEHRAQALEALRHVASDLEPGTADASASDPLLSVGTGS